MKTLFYIVQKCSKYFLALFLFVIFFSHQAKADCFVDGVQFDIGGRTGSGVTAVNHGNPITVSEIRQWDTTGDDVTTCDVSNLTNLTSAFENLTSFNQDIGTWDVSNVTNFTKLFRSARTFNQDISGWDVSSATSMNSMFRDARSFDQDISSWNVSSVTDMTSMFRENASFNQNITGWNTISVTSYGNMFRHATNMINTFTGTNGFGTTPTSAFFSPVDVSSPTLSSSSPADNATGVAVNSNIVLNFSESVDAETGNITIKKTSDDSTVETIDVTGSKVTGSGSSKITVNPSTTLDGSTEYYVLIDATAFDDASNNSYAGISSTTALSFTTADVSNPTLSSSTPTNNATDVAVDSNIVLNFSESVDAETGNITIKKKSDDSTFETISVTGSKVTGSGSSTITINPANDFVKGVEYYVLIDATAFDDSSSNSYAGISSTTALGFRIFLADPTSDKDVIGTIDVQSQLAKNYIIQSTSTVSNRLSYLRQNRSNDNLSKNNIKFDFGNAILTSLTNELLAKNNKSIIPDNWSSWSEGSLSSSKIGDSLGSSSSETDAQALAFGFDTKLNDNDLLGFAVQYSKSDTDIGSSGSATDSENINLSVYRTRPLNEDNFIEGMFGVGLIESDLKRISGSNTLNGSRNGKQIFGSINYGKTLDKGDFNLTPVARLNLGYTELDAYSETGTDALSYGKQTIESGLASVGLEFSDIVKFNDNKLKPFGSIEYGMDFSNSSDAKMNYVSDTSTIYTYTQGANSNHLITSVVGFEYITKDNLEIISSYKRIQGNESEQTDILNVSVNFRSKQETEYAMSIDGSEDLKAGFDITKKVNGFDLKFNANQSLSENSDQTANVFLSRSF
jgi:surface protein